MELVIKKERGRHEKMSKLQEGCECGATLGFALWATARQAAFRFPLSAFRFSP